LTFLQNARIKGDFCIIAIGSTYLSLGIDAKIELTLWSTIFRNIFMTFRFPTNFLLRDFEERKILVCGIKIESAERKTCFVASVSERKFLGKKLPPGIDSAEI
jgi:hypothetical protein